MTKILKILLVVVVTLYHIESSMASFQQTTNFIENIYIQTATANKGILSEFNENNAHETSNQDGSYSNDANIDAKKIGWHGISKDKDETKRISRSNNYGDPWKPRSSILDEERTEKNRAKGFIKYFILKKILQSKKYANMHIDAFDEISLADPFTSAAEESKLLDRNYFENVKCDINPLAFISLVEKMSFGTFSQMLFGGISMIVHVNMK